jgi:hypothetical protein
MHPQPLWASHSTSAQTMDAAVKPSSAAVSQQSGSGRIWPWMLAFIAAANLLAFSVGGRGWGGGSRGARPDQLTSIQLSVNLQQQPRPARGSTVCPSPLHSRPCTPHGHPPIHPGGRSHSWLVGWFNLVGWSLVMFAQAPPNKGVGSDCVDSHHGAVHNQYPRLGSRLYARSQLVLCCSLWQFGKHVDSIARICTSFLSIVVTWRWQRPLPRPECNCTWHARNHHVCHRHESGCLVLKLVGAGDSLDSERRL